ncbi:hypothetical protein NBE98_06335 [Clostridium swellfunianum]|uniref:hypothetical protein n=1 Tax=Clostridium swellfunianum TaxID=1367462 RepID=UPI00202F00CE|nr:hypothetical protein [Clostridium swellfunianum]MCM0647989.1 hypothetical protein [Clostridium swellfunianum]
MAVLDAQNENDLEFEYKGIKIIAARQIDMIVSKVVIGNQKSPKGVKLILNWE